MEHSFEPPVNPSWDLLTCSVCWSNLINPVHNVEGQLDESLGLRAHLIDAKQIGVQISARIRASWRLNADKSSALMGQQRSDTKASPSPSLVPGDARVKGFGQSLSLFLGSSASTSSSMKSLESRLCQAIWRWGAQRRGSAEL
ncbi:hypothetical protein U1Q18_022130 [Sarracenia purpurea var. burkii]